MVTRCGAPYDRAWAPACGRGANGVEHTSCFGPGQNAAPPPPSPSTRRSPHRRSAGLSCPVPHTAHPAGLPMIHELLWHCHPNPGWLSAPTRPILSRTKQALLNFFPHHTRLRILPHVDRQLGRTRGEPPPPSACCTCSHRIMNDVCN